MTSSIQPPLFDQDDQVQLLSDRSKVGRVVRAPKLRGGAYWYRIKLHAGGLIVAHEADLARFEADLSPDELLLGGAFGDKDDFVRLVTFQKLDTPLDNTLYSLQASRTAFYPHQYKPLLKFLDSPDQRLLIADEVGLGKTIEAGLVLIEQRARRALRRVLVICPAALTLKWREEMWQRFDEEFNIIGARDFQEQLRQLAQQGDLGEARDIISLQAVRNEAHLELLNVTPVPLDLLIVDEAHHLRNRETLSHRTVRVLAQGAHAVLFLTATPIQLGEENLFNLFQLLDDSEFDNFEVFQDRLRANEPVVEAQRLARASPPPIDEIRNRIDSLKIGGRETFFGGNPIHERIRRELEAPPDPESDNGHAWAADLQHDLEELSLLSHVFSRTKKRDVFAGATIRTARVIPVALTRQEHEFYDAVTEFVRDNAPPDKGAIQYFAIMGAQRQAASCMPAARDRFLRRETWTLDVEDEADIEIHDLEETAHSHSVEVSQRVVAAARGIGRIDTKYDELLRLLTVLDEEEAGRKIILFAYYKATLEYLKDRLDRDGITSELIHGGIASDPRRPDRDERGKRMQRFRENPDVRLLLSSEVGSEGLDFQFCHTIINYDLPWNPMRVEQRIGRVDRLGQESDRILIFNFTLTDTIEDRVLGRLYRRIGVFERTLGDLEAIIGEEIGRLTRDLLSRHLTHEEEDERIEQTARAIERRRRELEKLEAESDRLVSRDGYFEDQLARIMQGGELLGASDREAFVRGFLERAHPRVRLGPSRRKGVRTLHVTPDFDVATRRLPPSAARHRFLQKALSKRVGVTFDSEIAFNHADTEFLGAHHPVVQLAVEYYRNHREQLHPVSRFQLRQSGNAAKGTYLFLLFGVRIEAGASRKRMDAIFVRLPDDDGRSSVLDERACSLLLGELIREGRTIGPGVNWESPSLDHVLERGHDAFLDRVAEIRQRAEDRNRAVVQTRLASLEKRHRTHLQRVEERLANAETARQAERIIRLYRGQIRNMKRDYEARRSELEGDMEIRMEPQLVGAGVVEIGRSG